MEPGRRPTATEARLDSWFDGIPRAAPVVDVVAGTAIDTRRANEAIVGRSEEVDVSSLADDPNRVNDKPSLLSKATVVAGKGSRKRGRDPSVSNSQAPTSKKAVTPFKSTITTRSMKSPPPKTQRTQ
ncbi:hypothetical protein FRB94_011794 [Tulasnella sp. JGI-2019a]|nr:hypothetical protein FRB94_011794 [Tulasnella sp. JGI-2019a]